MPPNPRPTMSSGRILTAEAEEPQRRNTKYPHRHLPETEQLPGLNFFLHANKKAGIKPAVNLCPGTNPFFLCVNFGHYLVRRFIHADSVGGAGY